MKKLLLVGALALFASVNAQSGFKIGAHVGLPMGDAGNAYSFNVGVDAAYLFPVAESFSAGVATGYSAFLGKDVGGFKVPTLGLIPIAATGQYMLAEQFSLGADLGYGFLMADGNNDGGFYYQPRATYHIGENMGLSLSYKGVSQKGGTIDAINLGFGYSF